MADAFIGTARNPLAILSCLALLTAGCAGPASFLDAEADLPYYERVAVLPFTTLAQDRFAGEKIASVFFTEMLSADFAEAVDPGQLAAAMSRVRGGTPNTKAWSRSELARLAEEVKVEGFFEGVVRDYEMKRTGRDAFPMISAEVRLVDAATGRVVWSWSDTRSGGPAFPLWSWREIETLGQLSAAMCSDALETLK